MIIKKISDDKLKITLDTNDLKENNIDVHSFLRNSPETQDFFWDVMQEAEKKYGFNIDESMIRVDARVTDTGTFTLTVTKSTKEFPCFDKSDYDYKQPDLKLKRKTSSNMCGPYVFQFQNIDDLLDFAKIESHSSRSSLYSLNKDFYLVVDTYDPLLSEYSTMVSNPLDMLAKIHEYGKAIYKTKAIETIKNLL